MRTGSAARHDRVLRLFERHAQTAIDANLCRIRVEDTELAGDIVTIKGKELVNFGSCAYLGLNLDQRLKDGAKAAIDAFGAVFSSSTAYTSVPLYSQLEEKLEHIVGTTVVVPTTTTLGHLAFLPTVIGPGDAVVVDAQAHSSVHLATQTLIAQGIPVEPVPHNDVLAMEAAFGKLSSHRAVWYLADGIYSMLGDVMPFKALKHSLDVHDNLWAYIDDAHGFGWYGKFGRGMALEAFGGHPRVVVAASLAKSFGAGGAMIAFPDDDMARRVQICSGTLTFSGPLHPAELGAAVAAADIHLSAEHLERQEVLERQIELTSTELSRLNLPVSRTDRTPIWFVRVGGHEESIEVGSRMMADGYFLNLASFPAVPAGHSGFRFTNTTYLSADQLVSMLEALAHHIQAVVGLDQIVIDLVEEHESTDVAAI